MQSSGVLQKHGGAFFVISSKARDLCFITDRNNKLSPYGRNGGAYPRTLKKPSLSKDISAMHYSNLSISLGRDGKVVLTFNGENPAAEFASYTPVVDPMVLLRSFRQGVADYLYTCSCDEPACAWVYSQSAIIHGEQDVVFVIPYPLCITDDEELPSRNFSTYCVAIDEFEKQVKLLAADLLEWIKNNPGCSISPDGINIAKLTELCESIVR